MENFHKILILIQKKVFTTTYSDNLSETQIN